MLLLFFSKLPPVLQQLPPVLIKLPPVLMLLPLVLLFYPQIYFFTPRSTFLPPGLIRTEGKNFCLQFYVMDFSEFLPVLLF